MWIILFCITLVVLIVHFFTTTKQKNMYKKDINDLKNSLVKQENEHVLKKNTYDQNLQKEKKHVVDAQEIINIIEKKCKTQEEHFDKEVLELKNKLQNNESSSKEIKILLQSEIKKLEEKNKNKNKDIKQLKESNKQLLSDIELLGRQLNEQKIILDTIELSEHSHKEMVYEKENSITQKEKEIKDLIQKRNNEQKQLMEQIEERENKIEKLKKALQEEVVKKLEFQKSFLELEDMLKKNLNQRVNNLGEISSLLQRLTSLPTPDKIITMNLRNTRKFTLEGNVKKQVLMHEQKEKENEVLNEIKKHLEKRESKMAKYLDVIQAMEKKIQTKIDRSQGLNTK